MSQIEFPSEYPYKRGNRTYTSRIVVGHTEAGCLVIGLEDENGCQMIHMPLDQADTFLQRLTSVIEGLRTATGLVNPEESGTRRLC